MQQILIIDDESKVRKMYRSILTEQGYQVYEAANAMDAYEIAKIRMFDLILLDINMPVVKGDVLFDVIDTFFHESKVVIASVYPIAEQKEMIPGALEYFDKSHGIETLLGIIENVLGQQGAVGIGG